MPKPLATSEAGQRPRLASAEPLMTVQDVLNLLQCSRRWLDRERAAQKFPSPSAMIGKSPRWRRAVVEKWLDSQAAAKGKGKR